MFPKHVIGCAACVLWCNLNLTDCLKHAIAKYNTIVSTKLPSQVIPGRSAKTALHYIHMLTTIKRTEELRGKIYQPRVDLMLVRVPLW